MQFQHFDYFHAMPTPWGKADYKYSLLPGVFEVGTPGHGGIMVGKAQARKILSDKAIKLGTEWNQYITFEEDCQWALFVYEQPELYAKFWKEKNPIMTSEKPEAYTPEAWKESARQTILRWEPEYFI